MSAFDPSLHLGFAGLFTIVLFFLAVVLGALVFTAPLIIVAYLILDHMGVRWPTWNRKHVATGFEVVTPAEPSPPDFTPPGA